MKQIIAGARMARLLESHRRRLSPSPDIAIFGAASGEEIVELHREHLARLLILDVLLPGIPPEEVCRRVRADAAMRKVSLVVVGTATSLAALVRCAANRTFVRPLDEEDFLGAVRSLIDVAARKDFRVLIGVQITGAVRSVPFFGRSENISATGILFSSNRALEVGDRPELSLMLPGQGQVHVASEILRVDRVAGKDPKYGARFVDPGGQARQMIDAFICRRTV